MNLLALLLVTMTISLSDAADDEYLGKATAELIRQLERPQVQELVQEDKSAELSRMRNLENVFMEKFKTLLRRGETERAFDYLRTIVGIVKSRRNSLCSDMFSSSICAQSSPDPFYLWAKAAARDMTSAEGIGRRLLSGMYKDE